jgi:hypothetical protein
MRGYFGLGQLSAEEKSDILNQHKSLYNGYQTMQPQVSNTQPLHVYDFAGDKEGIVVNNKGEVKKYSNMGINEQAEKNEVCDECGAMIMDGVCECNYGHMEESVVTEGEMCECGGTMYEGVCNECGYGITEETGKLEDIYDVEDLNPNSGFDYIEGSSNDDDAFEGMHKNLYKEQSDDEIEWEDDDEIEWEDDSIFGKEKEYNMPKFGTKEFNDIASEIFGGNPKHRSIKKEDESDFMDYESSYTEDGVDDTDNEDDGFEDINSSEVTDEIEEQGGNADDMDVDDVKPAYDFVSDGPMDGGDVYPVNELDEDDMYGYEPEKTYEQMESAWADDELGEGVNSPAYKGPEGYDDSCDCYPDEMGEQDVSGVQGIYGDMKRAYDFDSDGPGKAGPYQEFSYESKDEDGDYEEDELRVDFDKFDPRDKSWEEIKAHTGDEEWSEIDEDLQESFLTQKNKITEMFNRISRFN